MIYGFLTGLIGQFLVCAVLLFLQAAISLASLLLIVPFTLLGRDHEPKGMSFAVSCGRRDSDTAICNERASSVSGYGGSVCRFVVDATVAQGVADCCPSRRINLPPSSEVAPLLNWYPNQLLAG